MQATPATVKESLTHDPSLLDAIRAEQDAQHAAALGLLDRPETRARIHLAEDLALALDRAGFSTHQQQIFKVSRHDREGDGTAVILIVHANIKHEHWMAGWVALTELLKKRGGQLDDTCRYTEGGLSIELSARSGGIYRGWAPARAEQSA